MIRYKNTVIAIMLGCILTMSIGYSLLSQNLNIKGTAKVGSTWSVKITGITSKATGGATNKVVPTYTDTTATFSTDLVNPGDKMTYNITVSNLGTLDAIIESVNLNYEDNEAIKYRISGIEQGYTLVKDESITFKVIVEYDKNVTTQPENVLANVGLIINAVQLYNSDITPVAKGTSPNDLKELVVTMGDGLYADESQDGKYIYKGLNPSNYIDFNNETWRILSIEKDGAIKIIRNSSIGNMPWDDEGVRKNSDNTYCTSKFGCNAWAATANLVGQPESFISGTVTQDATLNTYLNTTYYDSLNADKVYISNYDWQLLSNDKSYVWNGKIGLISVSEYNNAKATGNWVSNSIYGWTMTLSSGGRGLVNHIQDSGLNYSSASVSYSVYPALHLTSDIKLSGTGAENDHYKIARQ